MCLFGWRRKRSNRRAELSGETLLFGEEKTSLGGYVSWEKLFLCLDCGEVSPERRKILTLKSPSKALESAGGTSGPEFTNQKLRSERGCMAVVLPLIDNKQRVRVVGLRFCQALMFRGGQHEASIAALAFN
jgi:hypothetical protein